MKTEIVTPHPLAVLSAFSAQGMAILNAELTQLDDSWYQLLPAGAFKARDGRPTYTEDGHWHLDAEIAAKMIAATKAASEKVLIDYDHQALTARHQNGPVSAAAWLNASNIEWREGKGLYVKPEFPQQAQTLITNKEYGFLSAVFPYDKQGRPLSLRMAALTKVKQTTSVWFESFSVAGAQTLHHYPCQSYDLPKINRVSYDYLEIGPLTYDLSNIKN
ncbi:TPA: phage protease [Vibrio cholerae]